MRNVALNDLPATSYTLPYLLVASLKSILSITHTFQIKGPVCSRSMESAACIRFLHNRRSCRSVCEMALTDSRKDRRDGNSFGFWHTDAKVWAEKIFNLLN